MQFSDSTSLITYILALWHHRYFDIKLSLSAPIHAEGSCLPPGDRADPIGSLGPRGAGDQGHCGHLGELIMRRLRVLGNSVGDWVVKYGDKLS